MNFKKSKGILCLVVVLLAVSVFLFGCGPKDAESDQDSTGQAGSGETIQYLMGTGNSGGAFYYLGAALSQVINDHSDRLNFTPQTTAGSGENVRLVNEKTVEFALGSTTTEVLAFKGEGPYKDAPLTNIRGIAGGYIQPVHFTVKADSSIKNLADFKGKKIGMPAGVIATTVAQEVLRQYGLEPGSDYTVVNIGYSEQVDAIKNGNIDGAIQGVALPVPAVTEMDSTFGVRLIGIDKQDAIDTVNSSLATVAFTIPKGTYPGVQEDVQTVGFPADLIVHKDVPEDVVYEFMQILYDNHDEWVKGYAAAEGFNLDNAIIPGWIELHPGAVKYFKEKGLLK
ncbi:MAG: TAXI family TRAP transporter solute-binding subunit [Dehalobacterium sp.]